MFKFSYTDAEELKRLKQVKQLNKAIALANPKAGAKAAIVD
jgi:hypothetical protein